MKTFLLTLIIIFGVTSTAFTQVAINTTGSNPDESSILDISSSEKGLLIPRVNITDVDSDMTPVENPADGLLVYNIGTTEDIPQGFYYWVEDNWQSVMSDINIYYLSANANV